jgi:hypothetical protein
MTRAVEPSTFLDISVHHGLAARTAPDFGPSIDDVVQINVTEQVGEQLPWDGVLGQL